MFLETTETLCNMRLCSTTQYNYDTLSIKEQSMKNK